MSFDSSQNLRLNAYREFYPGATLEVSEWRLLSWQLGLVLRQCSRLRLFINTATGEDKTTLTLRRKQWQTGLAFSETPNGSYFIQVFI